jgi:hypothetical protein
MRRKKDAVGSDLLLQLVNSVPLSRKVSEELPTVVSRWMTPDNHNAHASIALFSLNHDARWRILDSMKDSFELKQAVCSRWAQLASLGRTNEFDGEWGRGLLPHYKEFALSAAQDAEYAKELDPTIISHIVSLGLYTPRQ